MPPQLHFSNIYYFSAVPSSLKGNQSLLLQIFQFAWKNIFPNTGYLAMHLYNCSF